MSFFTSLRDDKFFYHKVLRIAVPIMVQNGITNFVSLLDNIMIGQVGTLQMTGVSIVNQLITVFYLCIFGAVSGAGIFTAQFFGKGDTEGVRDSFRYKIIAALLLSLIGIVIFIFFQQPMIRLFLTGEGAPADADAALAYGRGYLNVMLLGLVPYAISQAYASTLRETGETLLPMKASAAAVCVNLIGNYILIFGKFGAPMLGAIGAAISTVLSRFVELAIVAGWTHIHHRQQAFIRGAFASLRVPRKLAADITVKGMPLLINEGMWSAGMAMLVQCYSVRSLDVVAAVNIDNTIANMFLISVLAMGNTIGIILGQMMGANRMEEAKHYCMYLAWFSVLLCSVGSLIMGLCSGLFPLLYNTTAAVRYMARGLIIIHACCLPIHAFVNASYFTLRSGGKTLVTFLFDSVYVWCVSVPLAFVLSRFTTMNIFLLFICVNVVDVIKCIAGYVLMKKGVWLNNVVGSK